MIKINNEINNLNKTDKRLKKEDTPLLDPVTIKHQEKKSSDEANEKVHMSYQVGDYSLDSDDYKSETHNETVDNKLNETTDNKVTEPPEPKTASLLVKQSPGPKLTPKKIMSFDEGHSIRLTELDLDAEDFEEVPAKSKSNTVVKTQSVMDSYKVNRLTSDPSKSPKCPK